MSQAIILVNAAIGTKWFARLLNYPVCFPDKRIRFYKRTGVFSQPTNGNAFFYLGDNLKGFIKEFYKFGHILINPEINI